MYEAINGIYFLSSLKSFTRILSIKSMQLHSFSTNAKKKLKKLSLSLETFRKPLKIPAGFFITIRLFHYPFFFLCKGEMTTVGATGV
jgi:hypothetical protein